MQETALSQGQRFNTQDEVEAEIRWFEAYRNHGTVLLPDPAVPAQELVVLENSADDILLNNEVYYSSFLCDDMSRAQASLVNSSDYLSLPVPTNKNNKAQYFTVTMAFLSSSSSTDVLGLMHERTGQDTRTRDH